MIQMEILNALAWMKSASIILPILDCRNWTASGGLIADCILHACLVNLGPHGVTAGEGNIMACSCSIVF